MPSFGLSEDSFLHGDDVLACELLDYILFYSSQDLSSRRPDILLFAYNTNEKNSTVINPASVSDKLLTAPTSGEISAARLVPITWDAVPKLTP